MLTDERSAIREQAQAALRRDIRELGVLLGNALVFGALVLVVRVCWRWRVVRTVLPE